MGISHGGVASAGPKATTVAGGGLHLPGDIVMMLLASHGAAMNARHDLIIQMRADGMTINRIADEVGISKQAVYSHLTREPHWSDAFSGRFKTCVSEAAHNPYLFELAEEVAVRIVIEHSEAWYAKQPYFGIKCRTMLREWLQRRGVKQQHDLTLDEAKRLAEWRA
jgi:predicted DNA-binding protein YlxM (UPF0122 family)